MNWRLVLEYDGRAFCGWQWQHGVRTVQEVLEGAVRTLFGGEEIRLSAAGRTDSGVHAFGQVVSFRASTPREPERVRLGLNTLLPPDLAVITAERAPAGFHARFSARGKTYRYLLLDRPDRSPFWVGRAWHTRRPLDWERMDEALALYRGTHDFTSFRGPNSEHRNPVRTIERAERIPQGGGLHAIEIAGPGFLRYQVRIMVGTLIEVGLHKRTVASVATALAAKSRGAAGRTALPDGLYLVEVRYPPELLVPPSAGEADVPPPTEEADEGDD